jgi:hypothetical protein
MSPAPTLLLWLVLGVAVAIAWRLRTGGGALRTLLVLVFWPVHLPHLLVAGRGASGPGRLDRAADRLHPRVGPALEETLRALSALPEPLAGELAGEPRRVRELGAELSRRAERLEAMDATLRAPSLADPRHEAGIQAAARLRTLRDDEAVRLESAIADLGALAALLGVLRFSASAEREAGEARALVDRLAAVLDALDGDAAA